MIPDPPRDRTSLRYMSYQELVTDLYSDLDELRRTAAELDQNELTARIEELQTKIRDDRFRIVVVGEFKRGKSTFLNALLGRSLLPTDVLPCSAVLTRVVHGLEKEVVVHYQDGRVENIAPEALQDWSTKLTPESEERARQVREVVIHHDSPIGRHRIELIDSPGLNDDLAMTELTSSILPKVDSAILVVSATSPFSEYERDFLESRLLSSDLGRLFFVVNGIDRCHSPEDAARVVNHVTQRLEHSLFDPLRRHYGEGSEEEQQRRRKVGHLRVFGLSAYQALAARAAGDAEALEQSGLPAFEEELEAFLTEGRLVTFFQVALDSTLRAAADLVRVAQLRRHALTLAETAFDNAWGSSQERLAILRQTAANELKKMHAHAEQLIARLLPQLVGWQRLLLAAAEDAIDSAPFSAADLAQPQKLLERLDRRVAAAVRTTALRLAEELQEEIERSIQQEVGRFSQLAEQVQKALDEIDVDFCGPQEKGKNPRAQVAAAFLGLLTGLGGLWAGFRQHGWSGAVAGALGSAGSWIAAHLLLGALGLPITWPVALAVGLGASFAGAYAARSIVGQLREQRFRQDYKDAVITTLRDRLDPLFLRAHVEDQVGKAYGALEARVHAELLAAIDLVARQLQELRRRRQEHRRVGRQEELMLENRVRSTESIVGRWRNHDFTTFRTSAGLAHSQN